jgi:hypothetical protein
VQTAERDFFIDPELYPRAQLLVPDQIFHEPDLSDLPSLL